jgi:hypothetical protein
MPHRARTWVLVFLLAIQSTTPAWAWGRTGHRVIAKLAERQPSDQAKSDIKALPEPGESLADWSRGPMSLGMSAGARAVSPWIRDASPGDRLFNGLSQGCMQP